MLHHAIVTTWRGRSGRPRSIRRRGGSVNSRFDSPELQIKRADTRRSSRRPPFLPPSLPPVPPLKKHAPSTSYKTPLLFSFWKTIRKRDFILVVGYPLKGNFHFEFPDITRQLSMPLFCNCQIISHYLLHLVLGGIYPRGTPVLWPPSSLEVRDPFRSLWAIEGEEKRELAAVTCC